MSEPTPEALENRLLLLAPTGSDSADARLVLGQAGFHVVICRDLAEVCAEFSRGAAVLLLAEESLSRDSLALLVDCIKRQPPWSDLPIILMTGHGKLSLDSGHLFTLFEERGNVTLLERPFRINTLLSTLRVAVRSRRRQYDVRDLLQEVEQANSRLEQRVAERTAQLNSSVKSLETFCYSLSHDMRAPLRAIRGFMRVIESDHGGNLGPEGAALLRRVGAAAERMDALINDLIALSRVVQAEVPLMDLSVARLVPEALENFSESIAKSGAQVTTAALDATVRGHPVILRQVIENFVSNALKYTKSPPARVHITSERVGSRVRIIVKDHGIGIAAEHHERVFELFRRLHSDEYSGTGVGLAIAKTGASRMGGTVGVISSPGNGSSFWVELESGSTEPVVS
jgi:signal transduction histidine kinase